MIEYRTDASDLLPDQLAGFFAGWASAPSTDRHLEVLRGSYAIVVAIETDRQSVVGFGTAISDGVLSAYIPLVEVRSEYRRRGIGSEIVRRLLARLDHLYMIDLVCDEELEEFYRRFGMVPGHAMIRRSYQAQSGS